MTPEEKARQEIDEQLTVAGWTIQDLDELNLGASLGVAVRVYQLFGNELNSIMGELNEVLAA